MNHGLTQINKAMHRMTFTFENCIRICIAIAYCTLNANADSQTELVRTAVARIAPSVVRIRTIGDSGDENQSVSSQITTGLVISANGDVLTSSFGFRGQPAAIFVEDTDGQRVAARVVATDHLRKLVLLKCDSNNLRSADISSTTERWPNVGATAIAVGKFYPGTSPSVSTGIISAVKRIHGLAIQTDAKISPVNYGGPLIGLDGKIFGLLVPLSPQDTEGVAAGVEWYDSGIGFCIPLQDALKSASRLSQGKDLTRGRLGIGLSTKNPLAESFEISAVHPDSPAALAGLKKGDIVVSANGMAVERLGHLQEVVKSVYAGESLQLQIKRGERTEKVELTLTDRLKIPPQGYVGLIIDELVTGDDDAASGVSVRVTNSGPAKDAGLPDNAIVTQWNEQQIDSVAQLVRSLKLTFANREVAVKYRKSADAEEESMTFTASVRPEKYQIVNEGLFNDATSARLAKNWQRSEVSLTGEIGTAWLWAPEVSADLKSGYVVLLSESETPAETVLKRWRQVCERHNLILVVPSATGESQMTGEHANVIQESLRSAARGRGIDSSRIVLVAAKAQADLCSQLIFNPRAVSLSRAVFTDCWPRVSELSEELVARKSISMLMLNGKVQSRQAAALQRQATTELKAAGVWLMESATNDAAFRSPEEQIAAWAFELKTH